MRVGLSLLLTMLLTGSALLLTGSALLLTGSALAVEPIQLRVLSYNIHHGQGVDGKLDLERIAGVIRSVQPDLVALQEVDRNASRTRNVDQPAELARLTKMQVAFGANIELQGGHYGNAVLSRFPITKIRNQLLPNIDSSEQRGVLITEVSLPVSEKSVVLLATHLDFRADERERLASAREINDVVSDYPQAAILLAGDLNATPQSKTLREFEKVWSRTNNAPQPTVPVGRPAKQIDFILYQPADRWQVIEVRVLEEPIASDHRPIFAVLELEQK